MRVICSTVEEFLEDLETHIEEADGSSCVFEKSVRVNVVSNPTENEIKRKVIFQASAIVTSADLEGQYLLEVGIVCGHDYLGKEQEYEGSEKADTIKGELKSFCDRMGLRMRPGVIDI